MSIRLDAGRTALQILKYLTPQKVLVLILIHAYCHALVAPKGYARLFQFLLQLLKVCQTKSLVTDPSQNPIELCSSSYQAKLGNLQSTLDGKSVYEVLLGLVSREFAVANWLDA